MKIVTADQIELANKMINSMPDTCRLIDVLTAGSLYLANAVIQAPKCKLNFERAFSIISKTIADLVSEHNEEGGHQ